MPCRSDYMEPNGKEKQLQETAQLLSYVYQQLGESVPSSVSITAEDQYAKMDFVPDLCYILKWFTSTQLDTIVYNGRVKESRALADWWERHQEADRAREAQEALAEHVAELKKTGVAKLTPAERKALGV